MNRKRAFTLIELLVVIAIIALLLSIMMPALGKAKEIAQSAVCMNNEHQMGILFAMYAEENNGKVVETIDWARRADPGEDVVPVRWADVLFYDYKFIDSSEVFYCPGSKVPSGISKKWPSEYAFDEITLRSGQIETNASFTYGLRDSNFGNTNPGSHNLTKMKSPSRFFLLTDITHESHYGDTDPFGLPYVALEGTPFFFFDAYHSFFMVHRKGVNMLKGDMSVANYKLEKVIDEIPRQGLTFWGAAFIYPDGKMFYADGSIY